MKHALLAGAAASALIVLAAAPAAAPATSQISASTPCLPPVYFSVGAPNGKGVVAANLVCTKPPTSSPPPPPPPPPPAATATPCPYAASSPIDVCASAPTVGAYQANLAALAAQPSILATHPQTYDVPGWDFPEGQTPGDPLLQDPATAALPAGCAYAASGALTSTGYDGGPVIWCSGAANPTFNYLDLSLHDCVPIYLRPDVTGVVTLNHVYSKNGANRGCSDANAALITFQVGSSASLDLETVTLDGAWAPGMPQQNGLVTFDSSGKIGGRHVALLNAGSRPISGTCASGEAFDGLVVVGMSLLGPAGAHGELSEYVINPANYCGPGPYHISIDDENVTFINPPGALAGSITAPFYLSSGQASDGVICDLCRIRNVTVVSNGVAGVMGEALLNLGFQTVTALDVENVYVDPVGSPYCALAQATQAIGQVTVKNAVSLADGSAITLPPPTLNGACDGHN